MKKLSAIALLLAASCASMETLTLVEPNPKKDLPIDACLVRNSKRGTPKKDVVEEIIEYVSEMPDSDFSVNAKYDIYSHMAPKFSEYTKGIKKRRALMAAVLTNLAGWESTWDWNEGIDTTNISSTKSKCSEEAGLLQTSGDAMNFDKSLVRLFESSCKAYTKGTKCDRFIACSKDPGANHRFTVIFTAMLLRHTTNHHGPIKRKSDVYSSLSIKCVEQIEARL
jgi:hypothetical protein